MNSFIIIQDSITRKKSRRKFPSDELKKKPLRQIIKSIINVS